MYLAAVSGQVGALRLLLELGADPWQATFAGSTAGEAARGTHDEAHALLLRWEALRPRQRRAVNQFGWDYFDMPPWRHQQHRQCPHQLRSRTVAAALSLRAAVAAESSWMTALLARALDTLMRDHDWRV